MFWTKLITIAAIIFLGWLLYNNIKKNPEAFSKDNINKSVFVLGVLALILIGIVAASVLLLKYL